jgi:LysR family transcriptional regulator, nod-box dependent transcriptional activator
MKSEASVTNWGQAALRCACETFGAEWLLLGTDWPILPRGGLGLNYTGQSERSREHMEESAPGTAAADRDALAWRIAKLRRYDLNLLLSLHALLHTRNVTQAGDWLGVTQPAMSSDLRRLRQMFKDELLVRYGREYQLTALASALVEPLTRAVADIERALEWRPTFDACSESRSFSIAMSDHVMALLLPALAARLPREAPNVTIHARGLSGLSTDPVAATASGEVDLSIGAFQSFAESCWELLYTDRWLCAVSADNPDVGDHMSLELFCQLPHLEWRLRTPVIQSHAEVLYGSKGIQRQVPLTTESFALLPALLRGSRMVALVHERLASQVPGLRLMEPPVPIPDVEESMYWSTSMDRDPGHVWLRELMRSIAHGL